MERMTKEECMQFLRDSVRTGKLATVRKDGQPLVVPVWYDLEGETVVFMSSGPLNRPKLPGLPGIEKFKGHTFHTSRWDYNYTGGNTTGGLVKLKDKRVGIIGTGATAIQCVSHLGEHEH